MLLILSAFSILFFPVSSGSSPNDACFVCHTSENRTIDQSLYNSNNHTILECIDCHVNSTTRLDSDHGQFIRPLNGSNVSGALTTKYYPENFSLCYYCHNESNVIGILSNFNNSNLHNNPPIIVSSIGSNFINNISAGYFNGNKDYPTNIHWNHLDDFGSLKRGVGGMFDYNKDGTINSSDSFQSCPACHNVHGTNYPKMTKNALAISYSADSNGTFGYIGSDAYLSPGGDIYCNGCHTSGTTFKYYRNQKKLYQDCISCHSTSMTKDFNLTAFGQGVHVNISRTEGTGLVNNNDCWKCHYQKDMNRSNIYTCVNCHVASVISDAPQITSHKPEKTNKSACEDCHDLVKLDPGINSAGQQYPNITSHYALKPTVPTENYCDYCHGPNAFSPFQAPYRNITSFYHDSSNASFPENSTCRTCHTRTDVSADLLANNNSNFHNLTTEYGDVNGTSVANCIDCHVNHDLQFAKAPQPSHSTTGMELANCYQCHGTKVIGTNATKLHDVRSFVTTGCVQCHVDRNDVNTSMFGRHANLNTSDGDPVNATDDDCKTCHFGSKTGDLPMIPGGATPANTYYCQDCHTYAATNINKSSIIIDTAEQPFMHGSNQCVSCHAPDMYHVKGTVGPRGRVENPGWQLISPIDYAGCHDCHRTHNGLDAPFHGPGIDPNTTSGPGTYHAASNSIKNGSDCSVSCHLNTVHNVNQYSDFQKPVVIDISSPSTILINTPFNIIANGSSLSSIASVQLEAAQYQVSNNLDQILIDWTGMNASDGKFDSALETVNATINTTGLSEGNYNVSVRVMASGPKPNLLPYYPLNGDWSLPLNAALIIEQPKGFINGTVNDSISGSGIPGVTVITNTTVSVTTDDNGFYSLSLTNGTYILNAIKDPEYQANITIPEARVTAFTTVNQDIIMTLKHTGIISGAVTN